MTIETREALKQHFCFDDFKPGQCDVIDRLMSGRSAAAVFPTGAGKSLCYQLPALLLPGLTVVVSPLIALMKDQCDALSARGIAAGRLDSSLSADEYQTVMDSARTGKLRLLYVAPERFNNERFRMAMEKVQVSLLAIDEAHCISEWGHNFRPDYLKLARFAREIRAERVLALTATATDAVLADICRLFTIESDCAIRTGFYRPNLTILMLPVSAADRDTEFLARLRQRPPGPTIVYVTLQRTSEELAGVLQRAGHAARAYHAGMDDEIRAEVQDWFMQGKENIVVATIAFGMGIDKANIRYVYHYNLPKSLENYSQEIGRAGRDGQPATCEVLACAEDVNTLENFIYGDTPSADAVRSLMQGLFAQGDEFDVSIYDLSGAHDIRPLVVQTLLTYLELMEYLAGGTPFYSTYQFQALVGSQQILANFEGERREFLANLFRQAKRGTKWLTVETDAAAKKLNVPRDRIVKALEYLGEKRWLDVRAAGVRLRFQRLKQPEDVCALADKLHARMVEREAREVGRLRRVLDLIAHNGCQVSALSEYFGQPLNKLCGHCSWCQKDDKQAMSTTLPTTANVQPAQIDAAMWAGILKLRTEHPHVLREPRALARLLCGVTSPQLSRAKLTAHPLFGSLAHVPFTDVLQRASVD